MKKVLWFSRHEMTEDQIADLGRIYGDIEVTQVNKTINTAYELKAEVEAADIVGIVAPINLQAQFLKIAGEKPVITAISNRVLVKQEDGSEDKAVFVFSHWEQIKKIEVVTERL